MTVLYDNRTTKKYEKNIYAVVEKTIRETLVYEDHTDKVEVSFSFVESKEIQELNRVYRAKDKVTDVLSFPLGEVNPESNEIMLGDIVISIEKTEEQAVEYGHSFERELGFLVVHSMLHLLGYDHMSEDEEKIMNTKQEEILKKVGLPR